MAKGRKWQRGVADMVSVGVGIIILGIVTAGTSAAMVYGREALIRQEHYKAAAYVLRGHMEEVQGELQYIPSGQRSLGPMDYPQEPLDLATERGPTRVQRVMVQCSRDRIVPWWDQRMGSRPANAPPDFYYLTMRADWMERDYAEDADNNSISQRREIEFTTAVLVRAELP